MEYLRVALPTRSVEVEITFSTPRPSLLSSRFRTEREQQFRSRGSAAAERRGQLFWRRG
jgi:hypothetical protein